MLSERTAQFTCGVTTGAGSIAMGAKDGSVRLFVACKNMHAKTLLPGFGEPVVGLDVTENGTWLLVTYSAYILVYYLRDPAEGDTGKTGFEKSIAKSARPKRLVLSADDVRKYGTPHFKKAYFDVKPNSDETYVVASTGSIVILWDFRQVKRGVLNKYRVHQYTHEVVDKQFSFGDSGSVVVALEDEVVLSRRKAE